MSVSDASICEKIKYGKRLTNLKTTRRNDTTLIVNKTELIDNREIEIDDLSKKKEVFSNDVNKLENTSAISKPY